MSKTDGYEPGMLLVGCDCGGDPLEDDDPKSPEWEGHLMRHRQNPGIFFLPHSCDEWVIGGGVELMKLIADAERLLQLKTVKKP